MIPKIVHYIWLWKSNKPKNFDLVIESWEKNLPDFTLMEWTEDNLKEFNLSEYFYRAMEDKKYAFASDELRCHILYKYGWIYLDTDLVLLKSLAPFLENDFYTAFYHNRRDYFWFQNIGMTQNHVFMEKMIQFYKSYDKNGYVIINRILSDILIKHIQDTWNIYREDSFWNMYCKKYNICIYNQEYIYPEINNFQYKEWAYSYHIGNVSWAPKWKKVLMHLPYMHFLTKNIKKLIPKKIRDILFPIQY